MVVDLTASVLAYDSGTGALSITANKPGTLTPETIALTIGSSVTFTGGSATSLTSGQTIEVHAIFDPASGAYTVSNIRIVNPPAQSVQPSPPASSVGASPAMAAVGQLLFNDTALSSSGKQSCATCHAPSNAFTQSDNLPVPLGGTSMTLQGLRNSPTVMYSSYIPGFVLHAPGAASSVLRPTGGIMWDGRQANLAAQAQQPFITSFEMGNASSTQVAALLAGRPYLPQFIAVFGQSVLSSPDATLAAMGRAIAAFEATDQFHPFSSKYDAYIQGNTTLTTQELAGMQAFNDIKRGNCAACHSSTGSSTSPALFTNYTYHNLGIPRNWQIAINVDSNPLPSYVTANGSGLGAPNHNYYDMGLCGPVRTDLAQDTTVCGSFKTPTLRNVGLKQAYDHNGVFTSLSDVVSFYATRNSNSSKWYKTADGSADILFNDIPVVYASNVEPLNNSGNPIAPHLTSTDVQNIVSFLCTLTDGFDPKNPSAYNASGQCMGL